MRALELASQRRRSRTRPFREVEIERNLTRGRGGFLFSCCVDILIFAVDRRANPVRGGGGVLRE